MGGLGHPGDEHPAGQLDPLAAGAVPGQAGPGVGLQPAEQGGEVGGAGTAGGRGLGQAHPATVAQPALAGDRRAAGDTLWTAMDDALPTAPPAPSTGPAADRTAGPPAPVRPAVVHPVVAAPGVLVRDSSPGPRLTATVVLPCYNEQDHVLPRSSGSPPPWTPTA